MNPALELRPAAARPGWPSLLWFGALLALAYGPVLAGLVRQWRADEDMSHGFFVPVLAGYIAWQKRARLRARRAQPSRWGLVVAAAAALQLYFATLGAELFLARTAFVLSVIAVVLTLGGLPYLRELRFPLLLLFFMVPVPALVYNGITLPLQLLASRVAAALALLEVPVLREGNILELANQRLSVVEACSGIRSLLSLAFL